MTKVVVRNGNVDGALRNLKAANSKDGSLAQLREKQDGYLKPGVRRRNAKKKALKTLVVVTAVKIADIKRRPLYGFFLKEGNYA